MRPTVSRRRLLAAVGGTATAGLAGCSQFAGDDDPGTDTTTESTGTTGTDTTAGTTAGTTGTGGTTTEPLPSSVDLEPVATGFQAPLDVEFAPGADRRYVADQPGVIRVHESGGLRDEPLLDLRDSVEFGGEMGLLGVALHPEFAQNRRLFVRYSTASREGTPEAYSHTFVLAEFAVGEDGRVADPDSERTILEIPEPQPNHNAGDLAFGPDRLLYVAVGDGGLANDQGEGHVADWYDAVEGGNGQDVTENLLGSILRIDVDSEGDGGDRPYGIPDDNPLVGEEGLDEQYAWGFRNPWRISFDGDDLYAADVGQAGYEEVNVVERGGNYGWNVKEGTHCFGADDCPDSTPEDVRGGEPLIDPVVEYPHGGATVSGRSVIGGHVYRGSALPGLAGRYVFGDLDPAGRLFVATPPGGGASADQESEGLWPVAVVETAGGESDGLQRLLSLGRDSDGEVYVLGTVGGESGLFRVVSDE